MYNIFQGAKMNFKNLTLTTTLLATILLSGCSTKNSKHLLSHDAGENAQTHMPSKNAHWGYTGHGNPSEWGELSEKYMMCSEGKNQSPINISVQDSADVNLQDIAFSYATKSTNVLNNGHTIQVNIDAGSTIMIDGQTFELKQFHFHTPSENQINGKSFPLEAHFVHLDAEGNIAVVAVMFEEGETNKALENIWGKLPLKTDEKVALTLTADQVKAMLPTEKAYYRFSGSLTTPPCSEGVRWFVLKKPLSISKAQVAKFLETMHHHNNRPIQKINARKVLY